MNRKEFLAAGLGMASLPSFKFSDSFWAEQRALFDIDSSFVNLENGYYCLMPKYTREAYKKHLDHVNLQASRYMRTVQFDNKTKVKNRLAAMLGCGEDELIITRNTTESLDTVINGKEWKKGDEAIMAETDYGAMQDMFKLMERRYGIVRKTIQLPLHPPTDEEIVQMYEKVITPRTKLLMICHMVNVTGQILPVKKICEMAHKKGVEVLVDGAHAFAHFDFKITDLGCDYYGASLHKWLAAPLGAGILYVKKEKIKALWPMFGESGFADDDIRKLNHTGTHPVHTDLAINDAIDFHEKLGIEMKENRLRFLQNYWVTKVQDIDNVIINTPLGHRSCAIANVGLKNLKPADFAKKLFDEFKIWTVAIDYSNVHGVRVTPHLYTSTAELDQFVAAIRTLAKS